MTTTPNVGLQVPGLFKSSRDAALKDRGMALLDQWRTLIGEVYRLDPKVPVSQKVRPGFGNIADGLKKAYRAFFFWHQDLRAQPDGSLTDAWATQLERNAAGYGQWRRRVQAVLRSRGSDTRAIPSANIYQPPKPGQSWEDWVREWGAGIGTGLGFGAVALAALFLWSSRR